MGMFIANQVANVLLNILILVIWEIMLTICMGSIFMELIAITLMKALV